MARFSYGRNWRSPQKKWRAKMAHRMRDYFREKEQLAEIDHLMDSNSQEYYRLKRIRRYWAKRWRANKKYH